MFDEQSFIALTKQVIAGEKPGFWSDWTSEQQLLYTSSDWRGFSVSRGYSNEDIELYANWLDCIKQAESLNINPYICIQDIAMEAALSNIKLDTRGEILLSSHRPFTDRRQPVSF